jgi:hypothetical protein
MQQARKPHAVDAQPRCLRTARSAQAASGRKPSRRCKTSRTEQDESSGNDLPKQHHPRVERDLPPGLGRGGSKRAAGVDLGGVAAGRRSQRRWRGEVRKDGCSFLVDEGAQSRTRCARRRVEQTCSTRDDGVIPASGTMLRCHRPSSGRSGTMRCGRPRSSDSATSGCKEESGKANDPVRISLKGPKHPSGAGAETGEGLGPRHQRSCSGITAAATEQRRRRSPVPHHRA